MRLDWQRRGACLHTTVDFCSPEADEISRAIAICGRCEVMDHCRQWADEIGDTAAVLGGEDAGARRARWRVNAKRSKGHRSP